MNKIWSFQWVFVNQVVNCFVATLVKNSCLKPNVLNHVNNYFVMWSIIQPHEHTKIRWTDRSKLINCSKGDRIPWRHDRTRSTRLIGRNNNYDRNVNGTDPDQMSRMLLAVHRQRRQRQVCQISEHTEERVDGTENKGITRHGRCRKISSKKNQMQQNKTCIGRRTDSDHQMCKWSSPVSRISRNRSRSRRKIRRNDSEQSNCVNQTSIVRDDCTW